MKSDEWSEKFCVVTNAGLIYFNTKKKGDYDPRKFYPMNDFQIKDLDEKVRSLKIFNILYRLQRESSHSRSYLKDKRSQRISQWLQTASRKRNPG